MTLNTSLRNDGNYTAGVSFPSVRSFSVPPGRLATRGTTTGLSWSTSMTALSVIKLRGTSATLLPRCSVFL